MTEVVWTVWWVIYLPALLRYHKELLNLIALKKAPRVFGWLLLYGQYWRAEWNRPTHFALVPG